MRLRYRSIHLLGHSLDPLAVQVAITQPLDDSPPLSFADLRVDWTAVGIWRKGEVLKMRIIIEKRIKKERISQTDAHPLICQVLKEISRLVIECPRQPLVPAQISKHSHLDLAEVTQDEAIPWARWKRREREGAGGGEDVRGGGREERVERRE